MVSVQHTDRGYLWSTDITTGDEAVWVDGEEFEFNDARWVFPAAGCRGHWALSFIRDHEDFIIAKSVQSEKQSRIPDVLRA